MIKILNLKLVILLEYQNIKTFLQKALFQISLKQLLLLQKLKALCRGHILLVILQAKKLLEPLTKKNCKKQIKKFRVEKESRVEKVIKNKGEELYIKWKGYNNSFNSWIDKKDIG